MIAGHIATLADNNTHHINAVLAVVNPDGAPIPIHDDQQPAHVFSSIQFGCPYCAKEFPKKWLLNKHKKSQGCILKQLEFFLDNPTVSGDSLNDCTEHVQLLQGNPSKAVIKSILMKKGKLHEDFLKKFG
jgi:hypothetical protein